MKRRIAKTIEDVYDLLADYEANLELHAGGTCTVQFPMDDSKWHPREGLSDYLDVLYPVRYDKNGDISHDPTGTNFRRATINVVRNLVSSPQFWRCTTVADQLTSFKRASGKEYGLMKITKRGGKPLTLHFSSSITSKLFFDRLSCFS